MKTMPKRDITGNCEGECRDRVKEGEASRQDEINRSQPESLDATPSVPWASKRNEPPGYMGGHV